MDKANPARAKNPKTNPAKNFHCFSTSALTKRDGPCYAHTDTFSAQQPAMEVEEMRDKVVLVHDNMKSSEGVLQGRINEEIVMARKEGYRLQSASTSMAATSTDGEVYFQICVTLVFRTM